MGKQVGPGSFVFEAQSSPFTLTQDYVGCGIRSLNKFRNVGLGGDLRPSKALDEVRRGRMPCLEPGLMSVPPTSSSSGECLD